MDLVILPKSTAMNADNWHYGGSCEAMFADDDEDDDDSKDQGTFDDESILYPTKSNAMVSVFNQFNEKWKDAGHV